MYSDVILPANDAVNEIMVHMMSIANDVVREILNKRLKFVRPEPDLKEIRGIQICPEIFEYEGVVERILSAEEDVFRAVSTDEKSWSDHII